MQACKYNIFVRATRYGEYRYLDMPQTELPLIYGALFAIVAQVAIVSAPTNAQTLEEVVVTAQKKEQNLMDVPISVSVLDSDFIAQRKMLSLGDIADFTPNVSVSSQTLGFSVISFRGLAGGFNRGFEQSAGRYLDGVFTGRNAASTNDVGDLARVEILRGPQGTLFGNNSITGTFNIITMAPNEEEFEGQVGLTVGQDHELRYNLMLTGPITDTLSFRFYGAHRETDGYFDNQASFLEGADKKMGAFDKDNGRLKVLWRPTEDVDLTLAYRLENGWSNMGLGAEMYLDRPAEELVTNAFDIPVWPVWQALVPDIVIDRWDRKIAHNTKTDIKLDSQGLDLTANYGQDNYTITSISAYTGYDDNEYYDTDFSPANFLVRIIDERYRQFTQELRISAQPSEKLEYIAGLYFFYSNIDIDNTLRVNFSDYGPDVSNDTIKFYEQDYYSGALFGQLSYFLTDAVTLTAGLRYSHERKEADIQSTYDNCVFLGEPVPDALECSLLPGFRDNGEVFTVDDHRNDDNFSPMASAIWSINDDWNTYARIATGFKSGGFSSENAFLGRDENQFEPEKSLSYEVGVKGKMLDGRARINLNMFYTKFDDLQVSTFTSGGGFSIGNAATATTQGVELDGQFLITPDLQFFATAGYTHARYDKYLDAGCTVRQQEAFAANPNDESSCTQDLSGKVLVRAPDWNASLGSSYTVNTTFGSYWRLGLDLVYTSDFFYSTDLDVENSQGSYTLVNMQLALVDDANRWEVGLRGTNLTNEDYYTGGADLPLIAGAYGGGLQPQSRWSLDLQYNL